MSVNEIEFVRIPTGSFMMGENDHDKFANDTERPRHSVLIAEFLLAAFPVTIGEYRCFQKEHQAGLPDDWPVSMVSWSEAMDFCDWRGEGYRLPSEAEWEYAARAGATGVYPWGESITPAQANYFYDEQGNKVGCGCRNPRGQYPPNAFGLSDMLGNVCEWVADVWHPNHEGAPTNGVPRISGDLPSPQRVLRGGAWDYLPRLLRLSWRDGLPQESRRDNLGFRLAQNL